VGDYDNPRAVYSLGWMQCTQILPTTGLLSGSGLVLLLDLYCRVPAGRSLQLIDHSLSTIYI
jgi:hypothetical protein